jgi:hypothetical protein
MVGGPDGQMRRPGSPPGDGTAPLPSAGASVGRSCHSRTPTQEKTFGMGNLGDSRAPAIRPARAPGMDGLGDQCSAATAQPTGELVCGSDTWPGAAAFGSDEASVKWSMMAGMKDVMSWGPRLVTRFPSRTTSRSSQVAPAFTRSSRMPGHEVSVRPLSSPADASTHGPWHSVAIGFPLSANSRTNCRASADCRSRSGLMNPPGSRRPW